MGCAEHPFQLLPLPLTLVPPNNAYFPSNHLFGENSELPSLSFLLKNPSRACSLSLKPRARDMTRDARTGHLIRTPCV